EGDGEDSRVGTFEGGLIGGGAGGIQRVGVHDGSPVRWSSTFGDTERRWELRLGPVRRPATPEPVQRPALPGAGSCALTGDHFFRSFCSIYLAGVHATGLGSGVTMCEMPK